MKTALVHDWLTSLAGAEKALQSLYTLYPSPIYTLVADIASLKGTFFEGKEIHTSFIQRLPFSKKKYRSYLPFFPLAIEQMDVSSYDMVLSSSHCAAKGVLTHAEQLHICYCHTPVRYAWDLYHEYLRLGNLKKGGKGLLAKLFLHYFRSWDKLSSSRVDYFLANSRFIARRIEKTYGRKAEVVFFPVNTQFFTFHPQKEDFYLTVSRLVPYKKVDLLVQAFHNMPKKKLIVIGDGPEFSTLKKRGAPNISFLGYQKDEVVKSYMQRAKAFLYAAIEDAGVVPVEAMSCGTPVIAYGKGGVLDSIEPEVTGLFFLEQTPKALEDSIEVFERKTFDPEKIRKRALFFSKENFEKRLFDAIEEKKEIFYNKRKEHDTFIL